MSQGLKDFVTDIEGEVGCESLALRGAIFLLPSPPPSHLLCPLCVCVKFMRLLLYPGRRCAPNHLGRSGQPE